MFINKLAQIAKTAPKAAAKTAQTASSFITPEMQATTQTMLKNQIQDLTTFAATEIPQMKATQAELVASLEKLAQVSKSLIK